MPPRSPARLQRRTDGPTGRRLLLAALAGACAVLALAGPAAAQPRPVFGFGDQSASIFKDARFKALHIRETRILVAWNTFDVPWRAAALDEWMTAAQAAHTRPLVTFDRSFARGLRRTLPTKAQYVRMFRTFRARYPWVTQFSPWNEANHPDQPTYRKPAAAAWFYRTVKRMCPRCTVTSPVILAGKVRMRKWLARFKRLVHARVRLWAVNDYGDFNRGNDRLLRSMEQILPGRLWVTETGGWVRFLPRYRRDERRAANATKLIFRLARLHSRRVQRWYFYQWRERRTDPGWDSGIIRANGRARPAYSILLRNLR